ncbi:MAG: hypothetical protein ACOZCL_01935 [Bacillota bacterium]
MRTEDKLKQRGSGSIFKLVQLHENSIVEVVELFNSEFYFMTSYPEFIAVDELLTYLLSSGKLYGIYRNLSIIGLAQYQEINSEYVFMKFKVKNEYTELQEICRLLKDFVRIICSDITEVKRIDTEVFSFDENEAKLLTKASFKYEVCRRNEGTKDGEFYNINIYSIIENEIQELLSENEQHIECNTGSSFHKICMSRYDGRYNHLIYGILEQEEVFFAIEDCEKYSEQSNYILDLICNKDIFVFTILYNDEIAGFLCLCDFDWENRNCRLKGGIYTEYTGNDDYKEVLLASINNIQAFCKGQLRMKRVWGMAKETNGILTEVLNRNFVNEGKTVLSNIHYFYLCY